MVFQKQMLRALSKIKVLNKPTSIRNEYSRRAMSTKITQRQVADTDMFLAAFPQVVSSAVERTCKSADTKIIGEWLQELLEYNSSGGNKPRGLMTVSAYQMLEDPKNISEESLQRARILGWCAEMLQTGLLINDDILDQSQTRRGAVCWYRLPHVGQRAINDSSVFLCLLHSTLQKYFGDSPHYGQLLDCFNEGMLLLTLGQHLDYEALNKLDLFTPEHWNLIQSTKLTSYTFKVPAFCGLFLANKPLDDPFKNTNDIFKDMGSLYMIQNDYKDCFGDESVVGKAGTDIQEGKCSWLAVTALPLFNASQRAEFEACYGSADERKVQRIKQLYRDVRMPVIYRDTVKASYEDIVARIQALPRDDVITAPVMHMLLDMMYYLHSKTI